MQPSAKHLCSDGWPGYIPAGSSYCCMCGEQLIQCRISPELLRISIPEAGEPEPAALLLDASASLFDVRMRLTFPSETIRIEGAVTSPLFIDVAAGQQRTLSIALPADAPPSDKVLVVRIEVQRDGTEDSARRVEVRIGRQPRVELSPLEFKEAIAGQPARAEGRLKHEGGLEATITGLRFEPAAGLKVVGLAKGQTLAGGSEARFTVETEEVRQEALTAALILDFDSIPQKRVAISIRPRDAACEWSGKREIFIGIDAEFKLSVYPTSQDEVRVEAVEFVHPPSWLRTPELRFPQLATKTEPFECKVRVDGADTTLLEGTVELKAIVTLARIGRREARLKLQIKPSRVFDAWVGIDFGTTNSCVAYWSLGDEATRMVDFGGVTTVPSVAYFDAKTAHWLGGLEAVRLAERRGHQDRLVRSVKRRLNEPLSSDQRLIPMHDGTLEQPEAAATAILMFLIRRTEESLQRKIEKVILTHPANFTDTGIRSLVRCASEAGLQLSPTLTKEQERLHRLDEPIAVAFQATTLKTNHRPDSELTLIYDFGGGTLDISLLEIVETMDRRSMKVLAHKGVNWLGGDDFTRRLVDFAASRFMAEKKFKLRYDVDALSKSPEWDEMRSAEQGEVYSNWRTLWDAAEQAKVRLSSEDRTSMSGSLLNRDESIAFSVEVSRDEFKQAVADLVATSVDRVKMVLESVPDRTIYVEGLDVVIASGKTSLIPFVQESLKAYCKKQLMTMEGFDVKECVAQGACSRGQEFETPLDVSTARRQIYGLQERTNCTYGILARVANENFFMPLIPEGVTYEEAFKTVVRHTVLGQGRASQTITVCQHAGDPRKTEARRVRGNRDITHISDIKVDMTSDPSGEIEVRMWLGRDGLLQAEASVLRHASAVPQMSEAQ